MHSPTPCLASKSSNRWRNRYGRGVAHHGIWTALGLAILATSACRPNPDSVASSSSRPGNSNSPSTQDGSSDQVPSAEPAPLPKDDRFEQQILDAADKLEKGEIDAAWASVKPLSVVRPNDPQLLFLTARVLAAKKDLAGAIKTIGRIPADSPLAAPSAGQAAEWMVMQGELPAAEAKLQGLLKEFPNAVPALRWLARIYNAQGRRWEAAKHLDRMIRLGDFTSRELLATVDFRDYFDDEEVRTALAKAHPESPWPRFAIIRSKLLRNGYELYLNELQQMSSEHPELVEPWVWTATSLLESDRLAELVQWLQRQPPGCDQHPEYWYAVGGLLLRDGRYEQSARCFAESIQRDRRHVAAYQGLSGALLGLGQIEQAQAVRKLGNDLVNINDLVQQIAYQYGDPKLYSKISQMYRVLGDDVAAFGWAATGATLGHLPMTEDLKLEQQSLRKGKTSVAGVLRDLPWKEWELPSNVGNASILEPDRSEPASGDSGIRMADVAVERGVAFAYQNGATPNRSWYTIEGIGGSACALDYDRDGWPDLVFSQGGDSPVEPNPTYLPKKLFRSLRSQRFIDVSEPAGLADVGYGQGMGVADIDQDGFLDVLVANVGVSRLYRNNGDGTFEFRVIPQPDPKSLWNSSIHAADLNGDSLPDILDASYIYGEEGIRRWCETSNSARGSCNPKIFPPGKNRILFSQGDWTWTVAPQELLDSIQTGYTLGTMTTNLDQRNGNDVYFANDVSPNLLLVDEVDPSTGEHRLVERGAAAGVATDSIGRAQASMGISCGDQNRDGKLDVIVTNFYREVSTLYLQAFPGVFVDGTRASRLGELTLDQLSFGSQFADLDDDGWLDFIAVNGHIDDLRAENIPFQMPTQILKNERGVFRWLQSPSPGPYFDGKWVGRGLQSLDYNRDGKIDLVATHLDRPAALLENQTRPSNHYIEFELIGTKSERDATGAILRIECGDEFWVTAMIDGDGFFGSNEKLIHVGIAGHTSIDRVKVQWPSGTEEVFEGLKSDRRYRCVEGFAIERIADIGPVP